MPAKRSARRTPLRTASISTLHNGDRVIVAKKGDWQEGEEGRVRGHANTATDTYYGVVVNGMLREFTRRQVVLIGTAKHGELRTRETRPPLRSAWVHGGKADPTRAHAEIIAWRRRLNAYLPANYHIVPGTAAITSPYGLTAMISGRDRAGWTLDGYVIPRLQSGLISAREFTRPGAGQPRSRPPHPKGRADRIAREIERRRQQAKLQARTGQGRFKR